MYPWALSGEGPSVPWIYGHGLSCTRTVAWKAAIRFAWISLPESVLNHLSETKTKRSSLVSLLEARLAAQKACCWWLSQMGHNERPRGLQSKSQLWQNYHILEIGILIPPWVLVKVFVFPSNALFPSGILFWMWKLKHSWLHWALQSIYSHGAARNSRIALFGMAGLERLTMKCRGRKCKYRMDDAFMEA